MVTFIAAELYCGKLCYTTFVSQVYPLNIWCVCWMLKMVHREISLITHNPDLFCWYCNFCIKSFKVPNCGISLAGALEIVDSNTQILINPSGQVMHIFATNIRADSRFVPIQWETSLRSNAISHWLGTNLESALNIVLHCSLPTHYLKEAGSVKIQKIS